MSVEMILSILDKLEQLHKSLLKIANEKTVLLKKGEIMGIDQALKDEQAHISAIVQLDQQREKAVQQYVKQRGVSPTVEPTISSLIDQAAHPDQLRLQEARDRLLQAIHELKRQNDLNQQLTYQSLQFVNLSLDMVRPSPDTINYSKKELAGGQLTNRRSSAFNSEV